MGFIYIVQVSGLYIQNVRCLYVIHPCGGVVKPGSDTVLLLASE